MDIFEYAKARILAGKGSDGGGNIINPDGSGVIKVDLNERVLCLERNYVYVKVEDAPFRTAPDVPIELTRIGKVQFSAYPWYWCEDVRGAQGVEEEYQKIAERCKSPWSVELGGGTIDDYSEEGYYSIYMSNPNDEADDYFFRVPENAPNFQGTNVTLPKGLYIKTSCGCYPSSFEILPATLE